MLVIFGSYDDDGEINDGNDGNIEGGTGKTGGGFLKRMVMKKLQMEFWGIDKPQNVVV